MGLRFLTELHQKSIAQCMGESKESQCAWRCTCNAEGTVRAPPPLSRPCYKALPVCKLCIVKLRRILRCRVWPKVSMIIVVNVTIIVKCKYVKSELILRFLSGQQWIVKIQSNTASFLLCMLTAAMHTRGAILYTKNCISSGGALQKLCYL